MEYKSLVKKLLDPTLTPYNINLILAKLLFINNEHFRDNPAIIRNTEILTNNYNSDSKTIDNDTDNFISNYFNKNIEENNTKTNEAIMSKLRKISNLQNQINKTKQK